MNRSGGEPYIDPYWRAEQALMQADFVQLAGSISLADVVVSAPYARKHEPLEEYRLVPMLGAAARHRGHRSIQASGMHGHVPSGVRVEYWEEETPGVFVLCETPPVDTRRALLLVREGLAIAIAAAGIDDKVQGEQPAQMLIKQCQGLVRDDRQPQYSRWLRGGFLWRHTLFRAWERISAEIPDVGTIAVRSAASMDYAASANPAPVDRLKEGYDDVADDLHYNYDPPTEKWIKRIVRN